METVLFLVFLFTSGVGDYGCLAQVCDGLVGAILHMVDMAGLP